MNKKLILVTGGTKGIGKAILMRYAKEGYDVVTCARSEHSILELKSLWESSGLRSSLYTFKVDLAKMDEVDKFIDDMKAIGKKVDVLVNNAGLFLPGKISEEEEGVLEYLFKVNLQQVYRITRAIVPEMMKDRSGHIFNICSTASIMPYINGGSYCITKYALLGLTKVLREEMKDYDVRVTAVIPGATLTDSWKGVDLPETRFINAEDVAEMIFTVGKLSAGSVVEEILIRPQLGDI